MLTLSYKVYSANDEMMGTVLGLIYEETKDIIERSVKANCTILTTGQRCADWFILRQVRVMEWSLRFSEYILSPEPSAAKESSRGHDQANCWSCG